ncbi:unnamed protein product [Rotaria magnacalcarata]|uniref:Ion transport domain-containing protein n=3 Tax=Rotaria magnacalcarata TaxID=392030 RepID=A0A815ZFG8_9BILA|nr:unnamed protein product [Rotaria magnacalcarata]
MLPLQRLIFRVKRFFLRFSISCYKRHKFNRLFRNCLILIVGLLILNIINGVLFSTILFFQESSDEPDYDLDTRPYYKTIEMKKRFDISGNYLIVQNFMQYQSNLTNNAHLLALNLHTNIENLHLLLNHTKVWDGPISLSIYVKSIRASDDIDYASIWLRCNRRLFKVLNIHLVISATAYERSISNQHHSHNIKYAVSCQHLTYINHTEETDSTPYPSNLLRNIARLGTTPSTVQYILTLDIDIFPVSDLFHHLVSFYTQIKLIEEFNRTLYVIPAFEIHIDTVKRGTLLPQNKRELILLWNDNQLQPLQADVCPTCQFLTNYQAWKQEASEDKIVPLFRPHYSQPWQPYYIGPKDVPTFDARFKSHAHARISQCCESFMAGYDYVVLNNVYLYRLGFLDKSQLPATEFMDDDTSVLLFDQFREDLAKHYLNTTRKYMEREEIINSIDTHLINAPPSRTIKNRLKNFLGFPKSINSEYIIDDEQCSWSSNTLLCATVFLEDAVNYQCITHKITEKYLLIHRWFSSPMIKKIHQIMLITNLCLAFFERPSSFSETSDVRDKPHRINFPFFILMIVEGVTLVWFSIYIFAKIMCVGIKQIQRRFWIIIFLIVVIYSSCEWFVMLVFLNQLYHGIRLRRIFRPVFMIESSPLMKKAFQALNANSLTIIASISLALIHILFFAAMAMFLFPRSDNRPDSQGSTYFSNLHDAVLHLLVLHSTANNPDVMMPAYSDYRLNALFFIIFVIIGIYWIQNIVTAVVYRAFRGYFLSSIINSQLRRRIAVRASFEILKQRMTYGGLIETRDTVPISVVQTVLNYASINKWHTKWISERLSELMLENETINLDQYSNTMKLLDLNPKLAPELHIQTLGDNILDRCKAICRSKYFDLIGTIFAILSVLFVTIEVSNRPVNTDYMDLVAFTLPMAIANCCFLLYFALEIILKAWAFGPLNFFRSSTMHILEATVAFTCFILQILFLVIHGTPIVSMIYLEMVKKQKPIFSLWAAIKVCNMLFIYRLVRFLPASKNIRIIVGTIFDEFRNGGAFFGLLFSFYYAYSILGMELFGGVMDDFYIRYNKSNITICGTYEQLEYWPNGFDDFYSSIITLYNVMVVNQWDVFVDGFRNATNSYWSELYFIFWYLFVTNIGLNVCLALSGDIHDAKKQRADQNEELIVSNMYDIYRSQIKEPSSEEITEQLSKHPYINFCQRSAEGINLS